MAWSNHGRAGCSGGSVEFSPAFPWRSPGLWGVFFLVFSLVWMTAGAVAQTSKAAQVHVEVDQAGAGGIVRPGSFCGMRLKLTDTGNKQRDVVVRITLRDTDGDYPAYTRLVTLNPGVAQPVWQYLYLPYADLRGASIVASVYAADTGGGIEAVERGRYGELLGQTVIGGAGTGLNLAERNHEIFARVGPRLLGLDRYVTSWRGGGGPPFAHEAVQVAEIRSAEDFPDSWQGLEPISTIVWGVGEPGSLRGPNAKAVREWIERGGHLVVVLPSAGQTWIGRAEHELSDMMPEVSLTRNDGVDMSSYAPLLSRASQPRMPRDATVYDMTPRPGVEGWKAQRILTSPDGKNVVVRRIVGMGAVTIVGLDFVRDTSMVDADVFWHRVLGTRGELFNAAEQSAAKRTPTQRSVVEYDRFIPSQISLGQPAARGVLFGIVAFAAYWAVAGFGSFAVLKQFKKHQYAWVVFSLSSIVFTIVAWGGAWLIKEREVMVSHFSVYDSVYGQGRARVRSWMSLYVPFYGDARITVGGVDGKIPARGDRREVRQTVVPMDTPTDNVGERAFPDTREYTIDVTNPGSPTMPVRSTVRDLRVDWLGGLLLNSIYPVTEKDEPGGQLTADAAGKLVGRVKHGLSGPLKNVTIVYLPRQRKIGKPQPTEGVLPLMPSGWAGAITSEKQWAPGETLDLGGFVDQLMKSGTPRDYTVEEMLTRLASPSGFLDLTGMGGFRGSPSECMKAISFIGQLVPLSSRDSSNAERIAQGSRSAMHGMDLSRWFTQPCVIIMGELQDAPLPAPLFVDDQAVTKFRGSVWVRWVYPLPDNPPAYDDSLLPAAASPANPSNPANSVKPEVQGPSAEKPGVK